MVEYSCRLEASNQHAGSEKTRRRPDDRYTDAGNFPSQKNRRDCRIVQRRDGGRGRGKAK